MEQMEKDKQMPQISQLRLLITLTNTTEPHDCWAFCLKQSAPLMPTLAPMLNPPPCPLCGCTNTHDPFKEAHTLSLCHTHTHTHTISAVLYNQQF